MGTSGETVYRFGPFEVDIGSAELLKHGKRISLQEQPFRLLVILLENSGEVVTRAEIRSRIWEGNTFVDFDSSLRVAVGKLRIALGDDAADPRYIETIPKRGYRFLGPPTLRTMQTANFLNQTGVSETNVEAVASLNIAPHRTSRNWIYAGVCVLLAAIASGTTLYVSRSKRVLTEKDTVILAEFANSTGDPVFDETLRQGLAVELEQSPFLSLMPDERLHQTLRLMGQPADARLTAQIARDVCERTAGAAVLDGSITSLGSHYVLGLRAGKLSYRRRARAGADAGGKQGRCSECPWPYFRKTESEARRVRSER